MTGTVLQPEVAVMALAVGLLFSLVCYLTTNLSPGGMITPGWLAISLLMNAAQTLVVIGMTVATALIVIGLRRLMILYGKRLFAAAVLTGVLLQTGLFLIVQHTETSLYSHYILGFVIPGLIAYQIARQKTGVTIAATVVVTGACYLVLVLGVLTALVPTTEPAPGQVSSIAVTGEAASPR
ncbi:poly-gamma-glutamate biosynthesis protein PgsC/CapC [Glycomyces buryatensis]|uniref:Capsule biosynthesis protein capC n=1 Tax=Glycomyces buryatensis TaxID=2570927 RepID=A0A4S8QF57_9ACTN|nr:poly-gamma-glutamate biosynthesis protein PgsC/CapC [Glycomyces buryatensis]THV41555.1 capsule biosynthesis protein capC [Glycomyces buryatensis]